MWQWVPEDDGGVQSCTGRLRLISSLLRCLGQVLPRLAKQVPGTLAVWIAVQDLCAALMPCCAVWARLLLSGLSWLFCYMLERESPCGTSNHNITCKCINKFL